MSAEMGRRPRRVRRGPAPPPAETRDATPRAPEPPAASPAPGEPRDAAPPRVNDAPRGDARAPYKPRERRDDRGRRDDRRNGRRDERRPRGDAPRGQAAAVNRSRPIYDEPTRGRRGGPVRGGNRGPGRGRPDDPRRGWRRPSADGGRNGRPAFADAGAREDDSRGVPPLPANPREAALRILHAVDSRSAFSDRMLDGAHERGAADPRDLAFMHELVKGSLRWRGRIDHLLNGLIHIGLGQTQPWIRNTLRLGAYQILFLDRVPVHAAVDESVKLAHKYGHPGAAGLVNSVLRRLADERESLVVPDGDDAESLAVWGSHPVWIVERWLARFGPEATRALLLADNRPVPVGLRVNALRGTREQLIERLAGEGAAATAAKLSPDLVWLESGHSPGALKAFKDGWCTAQDESEALVGRLVAPEPHERLLDLCAAPGGKCTHLAERIGDEGEVWAMERAEPRAAALEATIARLGMHSIHVVQGDGRTYAFPMPFDRVLVDAPCSGLGVLGRRADARWRKGPEVLREMPPIQLELLASGGRRVRPGGVLVYSVCSFEPEETTQIVDRFLHANPAFVLESATGALPEAAVDEQGFYSVMPHTHGCDGAFAARFRKT